jgi:nicotinate-nucleotide adenylyltransferase
VLFVVAKHNPWKKHEPAPFELRCEMVTASIGVFGDKCEVCTLEKDIEPPTYSYKVLEKIREIYPTDELFIICGSDTIDAITQWRNFETDIKNKVGFIEAKRNDSTEIDNDKVPFLIREGCRHDLTNIGFWYIKTQRMDASSTLVRTMISKGMNPIPYVNEQVFGIIKKFNLYTDGEKNI